LLFFELFPVVFATGQPKSVFLCFLTKLEINFAKSKAIAQKKVRCHIQNNKNADIKKSNSKNIIQKH